jgi:hypothetical protein
MDEKIIPFKKKLELLPGAERPDQVWECPCGSQVFNLRADYHIECARCDRMMEFKFYDPRLL